MEYLLDIFQFPGFPLYPFRCYVMLYFYVISHTACMTMQWDFYVQFCKSSAIINGWIKANEWCAGISLKNLIKLQYFVAFSKLIKTKICQFDVATQPRFCQINFSKFLFRNFHHCCCSKKYIKEFFFIFSVRSKALENLLHFACTCMSHNMRVEWVREREQVEKGWKFYDTFI